MTTRLERRLKVLESRVLESRAQVPSADRERFARMAEELLEQIERAVREMPDPIEGELRPSRRASVWPR
jgi:hypothetical protein